MQKSDQLDELDYSLVNALQIAPRAPWSLIGEVLGISPVTAARRWERLTGEGHAWMTGYCSSTLWRNMPYVLVTLGCVAGSVRQVADALADDSHAVTILHTACTSDLLLGVWISDLQMLSRYVLDRLNRTPGVTSVRVTVASEMFTEASRWRLRSLDPRQQRALSDWRPDSGMQFAGDLTRRPPANRRAQRPRQGNTGGLGRPHAAEHQHRASTAAPAPGQRGTRLPVRGAAHHRRVPGRGDVVDERAAGPAGPDRRRAVRAAADQDVRRGDRQQQPRGYRLAQVDERPEPTGNRDHGAHPGRPGQRPPAHLAPPQADGAGTGRQRPGAAVRPHGHLARARLLARRPGPLHPGIQRVIPWPTPSLIHAAMSPGSVRTSSLILLRASPGGTSVAWAERLPVPGEDQHGVGRRRARQASPPLPRRGNAADAFEGASRYRQ